MCVVLCSTTSAPLNIGSLLFMQLAHLKHSTVLLGQSFNLWLSELYKHTLCKKHMTLFVKNKNKALWL